MVRTYLQVGGYKLFSLKVLAHMKVYKGLIVQWILNSEERLAVHLPLKKGCYPEKLRGLKWEGKIAPQNFGSAYVGY